MDFCRVLNAGADGAADVSEVVLRTHQAGPDDWTPLQMVSAERMAYLLRIEVEYLQLLEQLAEPVTVAAAPDEVLPLPDGR